jgi:hypothetical protein
VEHKNYYSAFSTDDVIAGICKVLYDKEYNTDACDLLLAAIAN